MRAFLSAVLLCAALLLPFASRADVSYEHILHFDSQIEVKTNGVLNVVETIQVYATDNQIRHGIYRDFPQLYHSAAGLRSRTSFHVQSVMCDGHPEDYHLANRENGTRVYLGSASVLVSQGLHTYKLAYATDRQLGFFHDHDELYWNVTGNEWSFPMDSATATVTLPSGAVATNLTAYTGPQGARGRDFTATNFDNTAKFATTRQLGAGEGLTIVVEWPKGFVSLSTQAGWKSLLRENPELSIASLGLLAVAVYFCIAWWIVGRDPRSGVIIPLFGPPENFTPAAARYLYQMGYDDRVMAATILNLAVKGALRIKQYADSDGLFVKPAYQLIPNDGFAAQLPAEEEATREELVGDNLPVTLRQDNCATFQSARQELKRQLAAAQNGIYFNTNWGWSLGGFVLTAGFIAWTVWKAGSESGAVGTFIGFFLGAFIIVGGTFPNRILPVILGLIDLVVAGLLIYNGVCALWMVVAATAFGVLNGIFINLLKAPTSEGRTILDQIEGFKQYLSVAEQDRLNLENPPDRTPQLFEMFLPYALALDVEQEWSDQFADVLAAAGTASGQSGYSPGWYSGGSWSSAGSAGFATALGSSLTGAIASASTSPASSSGGGGGGSSGGGGGGGGGGGW